LFFKQARGIDSIDVHKNDLKSIFIESPYRDADGEMKLRGFATCLIHLSRLVSEHLETFLPLFALRTMQNSNPTRALCVVCCVLCAVWRVGWGVQLGFQEEDCADARVAGQQSVDGVEKLLKLLKVKDPLRNDWAVLPVRPHTVRCLPPSLGCCSGSLCHPF